MKKTLSIIILLLFMLSFPVYAASGKLSAPAVQGKVGEQVTVTVRLDNPGIVATRIFVRYESAVLRLDSAENGDVFATSCAVFGKDTSANPYTLLWDDSLRTSNNTSSGTLCTLRFTILKAAGNGETNVRIAVDKPSTFDVNLQEVTVADATCIVKTGGSVPATNATDAPVGTVKQPSAGTTADQAAKTSRASASTAAEQSGAATKPIAAASGTAKSTAALTTATSTDGSAASAAAIPSNPAPKEENGTTAAMSAQTVPDPGTTAAATKTADNTVIPEKSAAFTEAANSDTTEESGILTIGAAEASNTRHINLLWLLILVPVAVVLVIALLKKKK